MPFKSPQNFDPQTLSVWGEETGLFIKNTGDKPITFKAGRVGTYTGKKASPKAHGLYAFQFSDGTVIDANPKHNQNSVYAYAQDPRDSARCNLEFREVRNEEGSLELGVFLKDKLTLAPGEQRQLLVSYGPQYASYAEKKHFYYLHSLNPDKNQIIEYNKEHKYSDWVDLNNTTPNEYRYTLILLKNCISQDIPDSTISLFALTPLHSAIYQGNANEVHKLLKEKSVSVEDLVIALDSNMQVLPVEKQPFLTPLMLACYCGNYTIIDLLLTRAAKDRITLHKGKDYIYFILNSPNLSNKQKYDLIMKEYKPQKREPDYEKYTAFQHGEALYLHDAVALTESPDSCEIVKHMIKDFDKTAFTYINSEGRDILQQCLKDQKRAFFSLLIAYASEWKVSAQGYKSTPENSESSALIRRILKQLENIPFDNKVRAALSLLEKALTKEFNPAGILYKDLENNVKAFIDGLDNNDVLIPYTEGSNNYAYAMLYMAQNLKNGRLFIDNTAPCRFWLSVPLYISKDVTLVIGEQNPSAPLLNQYLKVLGKNPLQYNYGSYELPPTTDLTQGILQVDYLADKDEIACLAKLVPAGNTVHVRISDDKLRKEIQTCEDSLRTMNPTSHEDNAAILLLSMSLRDVFKKYINVVKHTARAMNPGTILKIDTNDQNVLGDLKALRPDVTIRQPNTLDIFLGMEKKHRGQKRNREEGEEVKNTENGEPPPKRTPS